MRQTHAAGEKLFVDFAGDTMPVFDGLTGEVRAAKIFVAVMGASNYTFAQARFSEALPDWIGAHVDALSFLGGVPKALVCDNLKAGVTAASRYEPGVNRTYQDLAAHYGTTIMPARPRKPRDKAKVEAAVLIVQRWILARLRNRRFFSLAELNVAIRILVDDLNVRLMRKLGASRREFFDTIDRPALMPLPAEPYQYAEWRRARVAPDYLIGAWGIDGALISAVRRSSVIFIMCVWFSRLLSQSFCLESNSPSVCPSKTTNRDGFVIFDSYRKLRTNPGVSLWFAG
jgi:hypothetical protein